MRVFITEYPQFFTASIKGWYKLLQHDKYKDIVIDSLRFLVEDKRIKLYAFAIMSDHIHLIWQMQPLIHPHCFIIPELIIGDFLLITGIELKISGGWKKTPATA
jgi:REP element-mobilizing transposase RayT